MKSLLIIAALCVAVSAYTFERDIRIPVYDVFKSLYAAAPLSAYLDHFAKEGLFKFCEEFFQHYSEDEIHDFIVVYKPVGETFLHGYYMKTEDVSNYDDDFFDTVRPIYDYLNSGEYYAFTPYAAKEIVPQYYNTPLKKIFYQYYKDVDVNTAIPLVFLVPKSEVNQQALQEYLPIADYYINKPGAHDFQEHFGNIGKTVARRDVAFVPSPYYRAVNYPYTYGYNPYYYNSFYKGYQYYPKSYYPYLY